MNWWILFAIGMTVVAAVDIAVRLFVIRLIIPLFERQQPFRVPNVQVDPNAETVRFRSADGLELVGSLWQLGANSSGSAAETSRGVVIFCPEMTGTRWTANRYCAGLRAAGFSVLAFDFRGQGESQPMPDYRPLHWATEYEVQDVLAAINFVHSRADLAGQPLMLMGISRGGACALAAASMSDDVTAVVTEAAFATDVMLAYYVDRWAELYVPRWLIRLVPQWHLNLTMRMARRWSGIRRRCRYVSVEKSVQQLRGRPLLSLHGSRDSYVPLEVARKSFRDADAVCHRLEVIDGADHNQARQVAPDLYDQTIVGFFADATGRTGVLPGIETPGPDVANAVLSPASLK